jgi:cell division protein FtsB
MTLNPDDPRARSVSPMASRRDRVRRLWRYTGALFVSALLANAVFGEQGIIETVRLQREHERLGGELARVRTDNQQRLRALARHDEPAYIEELSRRTLGLIKPGELVVVLRDGAPDSGLDASPIPRN